MALEKENCRWKKSEDEILKQGVMKYGPNKWNKVASLLKRTPLECKSRYTDYINKCTYWSEDEIKKLIEISGYLKPQWNLIGEIMGKSEQDCYEKYVTKVYMKIEGTKYDELKAPVEEYDEKEVEYAMSRINKSGKKK